MAYSLTVDERRDLIRCKGEITRAINKLRPDLLPAFFALSQENWINEIGPFLDRHFPIYDVGATDWGWETISIRVMAQRLLLGTRCA